MNMKRFYYLFLWLPFLTSCGDDAVVPPPVMPDSDVLRVLSVDMAEAATRSIVTTDRLKTDGTQIGVYAVNPDQTEYQPLRGGSNTAVYEYQSGNWNVAAATDDKLLRLPSTGTVNVLAFYPATLTPAYSRSGSSVSGIKILSEDDFEASNQTDYLYAEAVTGINVANPGATFTLKHALAKLTFKVHKIDTWISDVKLTALKIISENSLQVGAGKSMRLGSGTLQGLNGTSTFTLTATERQIQEIHTKDAAPPVAPATAYCLLAPAPSVEYLSFQLTIIEGGENGQVRTFQTKKINMKEHRWTAGKHLIINIMLSGMNASLTDIQVYDWEDYTDTNFPI